MKFFIALMFIAVVSAGRPARKRDVSEYYGAGWSKSADGYNYPAPASYDNTLTTSYYDEPSYSTQAYEPSYSAPSYSSSPSYTATTTYTDTGFSTSYGADAGVSYDTGSYGAAEYYPQESYTQGPSNEYLPPFRRRKLRLQKRKLRVAKRQ